MTAASGGSGTRLFDTATGRERVKIDRRAIGLRFSPDGATLVGAVASRFGAPLWSVGSRACLDIFRGIGFETIPAMLAAEKVFPSFVGMPKRACRIDRHAADGIDSVMIFRPIVRNCTVMRVLVHRRLRFGCVS